MTSTNNNLRECLKQLFLKFPETSISTTELRTIYQKCHPNESVKQSQKVPNYMWELANYEKFLERESNSVYRLASKNKTTV